MRVLMTGGHGFVGSHVRTVSPRHATVYAPASSEMDVRDMASCVAAFSRFKPDICFHMAAVAGQMLSEGQARRATAVNEQGTLNVIAAAGRMCRVVFFSSCHVYGVPQSLPLGEDHSLNGESDYAKTKIFAESEVLSQQTGDSVVLRLFNLTGPGQSTRFALADWAMQSLQGATEIKTGDLSLRRDYLDVRDAAQAVWHLGQKAKDKDVVNVCSGQSLSLQTLFEAAAPGCRALPESDRFRANDVAEIRGCTRKASSLGWAASTPIERTIADLRGELNARS